MKDISNTLTTNHKRETILLPNESRKQTKKLEDLDMMDAFLFEKTTASVENAVTISKVIIKRATGFDVKNIVVETEKQIPGTNINKRGVRLDVYLTEEAAFISPLSTRSCFRQIHHFANCPTSL